jgi:hypothetical protein
MNIELLEHVKQYKDIDTYPFILNDDDDNVYLNVTIPDLKSV